MRWLALLMTVAAGACGGAPPATVGADHGHVERPGVAAESHLDVPGPAATEVTEITIARPETVACALPSKSWTGVVQLRQGGPDFATVRTTESTVHIDAGGGAAIVDVTGAFDLSAVVSAPSVFLARPMALGDFAVPLAHTPLALAAPHAEGSLTVELDVSDRFEAPLAVTQVVRCADLTPTTAGYEAHQFVRMPKSIDVAIQAGTELRSSPRGAAVARVRDGGGPVRYGTLEHGARRVVIEGQGYLAAGWVAADRVYVPHAGYGSGFGSMSGIHWARNHSATCKTSVPIWGQVGGERAVIGRTKPGSRFVGGSQGNAVPRGFVAIGPASAWIELAPGAQLLMLKSDLERCSPAR